MAHQNFDDRRIYDIVLAHSTASQAAERPSSLPNSLIGRVFERTTLPIFRRRDPDPCVGTSPISEISVDPLSQAGSNNRADLKFHLSVGSQTSNSTGTCCSGGMGHVSSI